MVIELGHRVSGAGGAAHAPFMSGEAVPHVPAVASTQHAVALGNPAKSGAGAVHIFEPHGTGAAVVAPPEPTAPPALAPPEPTTDTTPPPEPPTGVMPSPPEPGAPPVPLSPLVPSLLLPQPPTAPALTNPTKTASHPIWRFILLTSFSFRFIHGRPARSRKKAHSTP
jgi:hypothetical protein